MCKQGRQSVNQLVPLTSTADDGCHKQGQVTVIQSQCIELHGELELRLHHVTNGSPQALEELSCDEATAIGNQQAIFIHARGQHGKECLIHTIL